MAYVVVKERCQGCGGCIEACPNDAVAIKRDIAVVDAASCVDCGGCESACPTAAIGPG